MSVARGLAVAVIVSCLSAFPAMAQQSQAEGDVLALLEAHDAALNEHDLDGVMATFAANPKVVLMGTGSGEFWQGRDAIAQAYSKFFEDFDKGSLRISCPWRDMGATDDDAWFAASCLFDDEFEGATRQYVLNVSAFLRVEGGAWRLQSLHASNSSGPAVGLE